MTGSLSIYRATSRFRTSSGTVAHRQELDRAAPNPVSLAGESASAASVIGAEQRVCLESVRVDMPPSSPWAGQRPTGTFPSAVRPNS